jgi:hypothetical protein
LDEDGGTGNTTDDDKKDKPGKSAQETINRYDALIAEYDPEGKDPAGAAARVQNEHPELAEHYEYALEAVSDDNNSDNPYLRK